MNKNENAREDSNNEKKRWTNDFSLSCLCAKPYVRLRFKPAFNDSKKEAFEHILKRKEKHAGGPTLTNKISDIDLSFTIYPIKSYSLILGEKVKDLGMKIVGMGVGGLLSLSAKIPRGLASRRYTKRSEHELDGHKKADLQTPQLSGWQIYVGHGTYLC